MFLPGIDVAGELGLTDLERMLAERLAAVVGEFSGLLTAGQVGATRRGVFEVAERADYLSKAARGLEEAFCGLLDGPGVPAVRMGKVRMAAACWAQRWPVGRLVMNMTVIGVPPGLASRVAEAPGLLRNARPARA
jgi:hypothetical protein